PLLALTTWETATPPPPPTDWAKMPDAPAPSVWMEAAVLTRTELPLPLRPVAPRPAAKATPRVASATTDAPSMEAPPPPVLMEPSAASPSAVLMAEAEPPPPPTDWAKMP